MTDIERARYERIRQIAGARMAGCVAAVFVLWSVVAAGRPTIEPQGVVRATGCLEETRPGKWLLVNATNPTERSNGAPPPTSQSAPPRGKHRFELMA